MAWKICIVLLFAASALGLPKSKSDNSVAGALLLEPGPVMIRGNAVEEVSPDPKQTVQCEVCQVAMGYLENMLSENSTEAEIKEALDKLCGYLPSSYKSECDALVAQYSDEIIELLKQELDPNTICTELGLCTSQSVHDTVRTIDVEMVPETGPECEACMVVMKEVAVYLKNNASRQRIEQLLKGVCSFIPESNPRRAQCNQLAQNFNTYVKVLVDIGPDGICKLIKLCPSLDIMAGLKSPVKKLTSMVASNTTCTVCVDAINGFKSVFAENSTRKSLETLMDMVCWYMLPILSECKAFIHDNLPKFFKYIDSLDAKQICQKIGACPKMTMKSPLDFRCHLGAVYRCSSLKAAKKCNSVEYCQKYAWNK